jgi:hypothetical protein
VQTDGAIAGVVSVALSAWCTGAHAYRPFESTDAAVVDPGVIDIDLGPIAYTELHAGSALDIPTTTINVGLLSRWEMVIDATRAMVRLPTTRDVETLESAALVKGVLREGALQEQPGWSVATEFGILLPTHNVRDTYGATLAFIGSHASERVLLHLNGVLSKNSEGRAQLFGGLILEGRTPGAVRPVGELTVELEDETDAHSYSALVGAIWEPADRLSFDIALRAIREDEEWSYQGRLGLTWPSAVGRT